MEKIKIGKIVSAQGLKGEVKVYNYSDRPERYEELREIILSGRKTPDRVMEIEKVRYQGNMVILKLKGIDDRNQSEALRDTDICITENDLKELPEDTFYVRDLIGMKVVDLGEYGELIEGYVSPLYPLDMLLAGAVFVGVGFLSIHYAAVLRRKPSVLPYVADKGLFGLRLRTFGLLRALGLAMSMLGFAASFWGITVLDLSHGCLMYSIVLWLNYFTAFAMYFAYKYIFCETKPESRGTAAVKLGAIFLIVNVVLFALHLVTVQIWNEAPNVAAFGILPADFLSSMNIFAVAYGLNNILTPIVAIARGLVMEKKSRSLA